MNYRHAFHAGNASDVFKHVLVLRLIRAMQRKEKGFLYLDTHAGRGAYDLNAPPAPGLEDRAPEWPGGIGRIWAAPDLPPPIAEFREIVRAFHARSGAAAEPLRLYPGSPWLAALARRPQDRMVFWEKQAMEAEALRGEFENERSVSVVCGDGYEALRAALPPAERRALVLIDPPFEDKEEFQSVLGALREGLKRFPSGVFAFWYPVAERARVDDFHAAALAMSPPPSLWTELAVTADPQVRMKGCGLLILNPPWRVADEINAVLPALARLLAVDSGAGASMGWLVSEK